MGGIDDREHHKTAPVPATGRPSIFDCRQPPVDLAALLDEDLPAPRNARVLDAGCGPGLYVPATSARAADLVVLDIARGRLDGVDAAAAELRRVIRRGGVLYAFTNSEYAQWELAELIDRNGCDPSAGGDFDALRFSNENGADLLRAGFDDVRLVELTDSRLVVPDPEQIVDEIERNRYLYEPGLRRGVTWAAFINAVRRDAQGVVARQGAFRIRENHGLFTCR